jgi:hypothetical protein
MVPFLPQIPCSAYEQHKLHPSICPTPLRSTELPVMLLFIVFELTLVTIGLLEQKHTLNIGGAPSLALDHTSYR